jgi:hypothetical protein
MSKTVIFKRFQEVYNSTVEKIKAGPDINEISEEVNKLSSLELLDPLYAKKVEKQIIDFYQYKLKALREVEEYIMGFNWLTNVSVKTLDRVRFFITHNCSYKDTHDRFGGELSALQVSIYRNSHLLEKKIGADTIDLIQNAKTKEEVNSAINIFSGNIDYIKTSKLVVKEVAQILPEAKKSTDLEGVDCITELRFLKSYSIENIKETVKSLSADKTSFILYILENDDIYFRNEKELFREFINCKITLDVLKEKLIELANEKPYSKLMK